MSPLPPRPGAGTSTPLVRPLLPPFDAFAQKAREIWATGRVSNAGPLESELTRMLQSELGWSHVTLTSNCTVGLQLAVRALGLTGEVILPAFAHPAAFQALRWNGIEPVPADVEPDTLTLDVERAEELVSADTSGVLVVHTFGNPADMDALRSMTSRLGLALLADSASAVGTRYRDRPLSELGDACVFSFHSTKIFGTGEGGAVCSNDEELCAGIRRLTNFGMSDVRAPDEWGTNAKYNEILAAFGIATLPLLRAEIDARGLAVEKYRARLGSHKHISLIAPRPHTTPNHAYLPIRIRSGSGSPLAGRAKELLASVGIDTRQYFGGQYRIDATRTDRVPEANAAARDVLCLPLWGGIDDRIISTVCELVLDLATTG